MRLLFLDKYKQDVFIALIERSKTYDQIRLDGKKIERMQSWDRKNYDDLAHFAGVMGKFDPYFEVLAKPLPLRKATYAEIAKIYPEFIAARDQIPSPGAPG